MELLKEAQADFSWIQSLRRQIHRHPEHGNQEFETAALIAETLTGLGLQPRRLLDTAVVCDIEGAAPGKTVALRADMDALPIQEETGLPFASAVPGMMHACGHDFHVAGLLGAAKLLCGKQFSGRVRFLFQPDEELEGGAKRMIDAGCLSGVDAVFGAHVRPDLPVGQVGVRYGAFYAASNPFTIQLHGLASHGAEPERGADALLAGAQLVTALQTLVSRRVAPTDTAVLTVGTFHAGVQENILADHAELKGILRSFGAEQRKRLTAAVETMAAGVAAAMGVTAETKFIWGYPGILNHRAETALVEAAARNLLGDAQVTVLDQPTLTTEDFGYFLEKVPGSYYHLGVGGGAPLHASHFCPDEAALPVLAALHAKVALAALQQ